MTPLGRTYNRSSGGFTRRVDKAPAARGARRAWRVSVSRLPDAGDLRRQGAAAARPAALVLHRGIRRNGARLGARQEDLRLRVRDDGERGRGAGPRVQPDQELQAALQYPPQRRQELPVPEAPGQGGVPAGALLAASAERRLALLRAVHVGAISARNGQVDQAAAALQDVLR